MTASAHLSSTSGSGHDQQIEAQPNRSTKPLPMRTCIVSGDSLPKAALLRCVVDPQGGLVADLAQRLPGKGLWIKPERSILEQALKKRSFARVARRSLDVPADFIDTVIAGYRRMILGQLGLMRRSGKLILGFEKVKAASQGKQEYYVFVSCDISQASLAKLRAEDLIVLPFTTEQLGAAFGRANTGFLAHPRQAAIQPFLHILEQLQSLQVAGKPAIATPRDGAPLAANSQADTACLPSSRSATSGTASQSGDITPSTASTLACQHD